MLRKSCKPRAVGSGVVAEKNVLVARNLGTVTFLFMCAVSVLIAVTEDVDITTFLLIVLGPLVAGGVAYFVGLYHDPRTPI